jgi:MFS family permease
LVPILASALIAGFFLDWTRRGVKQPLVQNVVRPELRSTAMALTEFFQGAVASVIIILFGRFADQYGLTRTLLVLAAGFWAVALVVTVPYYFVYPPEAKRLREAMQERREIIVGERT